jgi:hypothetical protein
MATAGMGIVGEVLVIVQTKADATDHEINRMLEAIQKRPSGEPLRILLVSGGGASSPLQRQRIIEVLKSRQARIAVVTSSAGAKGNITAVGWFVDGTKCFPPDRSDDICRHLGLSPAEMKQVETTYAGIRKKLDNDSSLPELRLAAGR